MSEPGQRALSPGLVRLMAVTCAVTVANLYYAQPLLHSIGNSLHVSQGSASLLVTVGQLGYAAGLLLIVPAGDIVRRRPLLTGLLAFCAVTLAGCALAPSLLVLDLAAALCGVTSVVVQMLVPYAATLADDRERSRVIGTLMGGLLIGILLSRTFAGRCPTTGASSPSATASSCGACSTSPASLALLVVGVLLMDACVQGAHVINQSVIYDLLPQARSRIATVYITTMFAGGALGSAVGAQAYEAWGWTGATLVAAAFPVTGLSCWLASGRYERA